MPHSGLARQVARNLAGLHFHPVSNSIAFQARKFYYAIGTVLVTTLLDIAIHLLNIR
jgi:hypothetical protein